MMLDSGLKRASVLLALILAGLAGCGRGVTTSELASEEGLLRYVPADTPYVLASGEPMPEDLVDKLEPVMAEMLDAYRIVMVDITRQATAENADELDEEQLEAVFGVLNEVSTLFSIEGLREAGFDRDSQLVFYGHGLLPVLRLEVTDPALFEAKIDDIEEAAGQEMQTAELAGNTYRYIDLDEARAVLAVIDGSAVFTLMPTVLDEAQARQLLGIDLPEENIGAAGTLSEIASTYGFTDHYAGFIDTTRIAGTFLDDPGAIDAALLGAAEFDPDGIEPVCRDEIRKLAGIVPRAVVGYREASTEALDTAVVVEVRQDLARSMAGLASRVPGLGFDPGGVASFGMSFNLTALREFYAARLDAIEADPWECEYFAELQAGVEQGRQLLQQPVPPVVYGLRGFNLLVHEIGDFDLASARPPEDVEASVVLATDDAETLVAGASMFSPELAAISLEPNGKPAKLDMPQINAFVDNAWVAMSADSLAVSVGPEAESRVSEVLAAEGTEPPPVMAGSLDAKRYYEAMAEDMMMFEPPSDDEAADLSPAAKAALSDSMRILADLYDRQTMEVTLTDKGVEVETRITFQD